MAELGIKQLWLKDEGLNPTASLKDRPSAIAVVKAVEEGFDTVACSSTGNAASSLAGSAASMGLKSVILLRFEVADTGIGIDADAMDEIFSAFRQADNSTTRRYGGSGLGLSITRQLAELMGGEAGVSSTLGQGSVFWFTASLQRNAAPAPRPTTSLQLPESAEVVLARDYAGCRFLLVEDEINPFNPKTCVSWKIQPMDTLSIIHLSCSRTITRRNISGARLNPFFPVIFIGFEYLVYSNPKTLRISRMNSESLK